MYGWMYAYMYFVKKKTLWLHSGQWTASNVLNNNMKTKSNLFPVAVDTCKGKLINSEPTYFFFATFNGWLIRQHCRLHLKRLSRVLTHLLLLASVLPSWLLSNKKTGINDLAVFTHNTPTYSNCLLFCLSSALSALPV